MEIKDEQIVLFLCIFQKPEQTSNEALETLKILVC